MGARVVDASALAAVLFGEPAADELVAQLEGFELAAPALIVYELGNTCWKKCRRHPELAAALRSAFATLHGLGVQLHDVDVLEVLDLAVRMDITFYDAAYLWLARRLAAPLVTLDGRLSAVC